MEREMQGPSHTLPIVYTHIERTVLLCPNHTFTTTNTSNRNVGVPLGPGKQTNQRAELMAIKIALDKAPVTADVVIRSDSMYAIECITSWHSKWQLASWKTPAGILKENNALIELILRRMRVRKLAGAATKFFWVKGHAGDEGNERADKLAVQGSR